MGNQTKSNTFRKMGKTISKHAPEILTAVGIGCMISSTVLAVKETPKALTLIEDKLKSIEMNDYDRLIQLCDSLAGSEKILNIEERMADVKRRYGQYPQEKWNKNLQLKQYFENKIGKDIYTVVGKDHFKI